MPKRRRSLFGPRRKLRKSKTPAIESCRSPVMPKSTLINWYDPQIINILQNHVLTNGDEKETMTKIENKSGLQPTLRCFKQHVRRQREQLNKANLIVETTTTSTTPVLDSEMEHQNDSDHFPSMITPNHDFPVPYIPDVPVASNVEPVPIQPVPVPTLKLFHYFQHHINEFHEKIKICLEFIRNNSPELKSHVQQLLIDFDLIAEDCEQALLLNNHFDIKIEATKDFAKNIVEYFRKKSIYIENEYLSNFGFETLLKYFKSQLNTSHFWISKLENFEEFNDVYGQYSAATALNITLIVCGKIAKEFYNDSGTITWKNENFTAEDDFSSLSLYDWENLDENTYNRLFYDLIENGK